VTSAPFAVHDVFAEKSCKNARMVRQGEERFEGLKTGDDSSGQGRLNSSFIASHQCIAACRCERKSNNFQPPISRICGESLQSLTGEPEVGFSKRFPEAASKPVVVETTRAGQIVRQVTPPLGAG
jgi:hypothetical protein